MKLFRFPVKMGFVLPTRQSCVCPEIDSNSVIAEHKPNKTSRALEFRQ